MTKILLVANTDWFLYRYRLSLARFLRRRGMEVVLVSPRGNYTLSLLAEGFRWIEWKVGRQTSHIFEELASVFSLVQIFYREHPSLVHLHTIKPVLYGSLAASLTGIHAVVRSVTGRGYVFLGEDARAHWLRFVVSLIYRLLSAKATIFENFSDLNFFLEKKLVRPSAAYLIEGVGVDVNYYVPVPEPEGTPVVLLASRLLWDKGVGTLVEAARILRSRLDVRIVLAGKPDEGNPSSIPLDVLRGWEREGVVEWWGWQEDMRATYAACWVVTLPSLGEGLPTTLLEAAACGRPLVATDVPGCREVVENGVNGLLVPPANPIALAEALERLLRDPVLRQQMGTAARRRVEERFSDVIINARTLEVYESLLS